MTQADTSPYLLDDIVYAFGEEAGQLWHAYCGMRERITSEVDAGRHPAVSPKDVGLLYRLVRDLGLDAPMEFRMAQNRMTIDKEHYGCAIVGMGDLLAIRSIESVVAARVECKIAKSIEEPLVRKIASSIRQSECSRGARKDVELAKQVLAISLADVAAMAAAQNGIVTSMDIERLERSNGINALEASP